MQCNDQSEEIMYRTWIELDRDALENNCREIKKVLAPGCRIMGVVKANAYGHGAKVVSSALQDMGIRDFAVATVDEGIELRQSGIFGQILILGHTSPERAGDLLYYRLSQTAVNLEHAEALENAVSQIAQMRSESGFEDVLPVHIGVDTGMHRIGFPDDDISEIEKVYDLQHLRVEGIFSHLCAADTDDPGDTAFTERQIQSYFNVVEQLRKRGIDVCGLHLQNSYGSVNYTPMDCDWARLGILMYGAKSAHGDLIKNNVHLEPVMTLKASVTTVRTIQPEETVGYGRTYRAESQRVIASVGIGYADGIPRQLGGGRLTVLIHGRKAKGVGRICMDQLMIDVTDIPDVHSGDVVTLIGRDGDEKLQAEDMAGWAGTITNDLLSRLSTRIENHGFGVSGA